MPGMGEDLAEPYPTAEDAFAVAHAESLTHAGEFGACAANAVALAASEGPCVADVPTAR